MTRRCKRSLASIEALNAMHTDINIGEARKHLRRLPYPMLISAFGELGKFDKLKSPASSLPPMDPMAEKTIWPKWILGYQ